MKMGLRARSGPLEMSEFNGILLPTVKRFNNVWDGYVAESGDPNLFDVKRNDHKRHSDAYQEDKI